MYSLKTPSPSQHVALGRAFSEELLNKKIEMVDRRNVTAYYLGTIAGGSLPVMDGSAHQISEVYRTQHLPLVKEWLGRLAEAISIDIELALIASFNRYRQRCNVAYPQRATLGMGASEGSKDTLGEQLGLFEKLVACYPCLAEEVSWAIRTLITVEKTNG